MQATASGERGSGSWHNEAFPKPSIDFTIPSIHDGIVLECRLYHPKRSKQSAAYPESKAVTIAHPYAPLGGSFDDHVVHAAGREFLSQGYVLGLFNLRGAGGSSGHTSWSSKPEQDDYISFIGFLACYMKELQHSYDGNSKLQAENQEVSATDATLLAYQSPETRDHSTDNAADQDLTLVLGGYSYGSHIVRHLPDVSSILDLFVEPASGTAAAEIKSCATQLAQKHFQNQESFKVRNSIHATRSPFSRVHGGETSEDQSHLLDQRPRKSLDRLRESIKKPHIQIFKHRQSSDHHEGKRDTLPDSKVLSYPEIRYLLISPLLPPVAAFLALSSHWWRTDPAAQERLARHQCFALWGDHDMFTSSKKLNKWAKELAEADASMFQYTELPDIGHFWLEQDAEARLRHSLRTWIQKCDSQ